MDVKCVKNVMTLSDGRRRVQFTDGTTTNYARLVAAVKIRRPLLRTEVVHHRNGDCSDDRFENLEVLSNRDHSRWHGAHPRPAMRAPNATMAYVTLRLPKDLHEKLKTVAARNGRSQNAEMVHRIQRAVEGWKQ